MIAQFACVLGLLNNVIILNDHNNLPRRVHSSDPEWTRVGSQPKYTTRVADLRCHTQVPGTIVAPTASAPQAASPATAQRHSTVCQDLSTRNVFPEIGTQHSFRGSRVAAEPRLILFIIISCQTHSLRATLQYASYHACRNVALVPSLCQTRSVVSLSR